MWMSEDSTMIRNIVFDFGAVLMEWNPHYLFDDYFKDEAVCDYFLREVCNAEWNIQMDKGKPIRVGVAERIALFPEWEKEIRMYFDRWLEMIGGPVPGMLDLQRELKSAGYGLYGLTNWSSETFCLVCDNETFNILDGKVVSGEEKMVKPEPEIFRCLLGRFNLKAEECVFIDDVPKNVDGALRMGMRGIVFKDASRTRKELAAMGVKVSL